MRHRQYADLLARRHLIVDEVHRPGLVEPRGLATVVPLIPVIIFAELKSWHPT